MRTFCTAVLLTLLSATLLAQNIRYQNVQAPKRELRAAWVATVLNIDYPKSPSTNPIALKEQYRNMLDQLQTLGLNTVMVQVRPAGDALYPSQYAPWSAYLTGRQGAPPKEEFDPLAFMIEETHRRGIAFHAWINPFRAAMNLDTASLFITHPINTHPDWLVAYGGKMYFNPGIPEVRQHVVDVVGEIVDNYDVDGIHIDDYFYPYPVQGAPFPDAETYRFYGRLSPTIEDWRRSNTDQLVQAMSDRIKLTRPSIQFGISPFGVWRNKSDEAPKGSDTRAGVTSYDDLYADVLNWVNRGWVDYVMPQLYWHIGYELADHEKLVRWWSQNARTVPIYVGHAAYKVGDNPEEAWMNPGEIPRQIDLSRRNFQTEGSAFFSAKSLINNPLRLKDSLRHYYRMKALWPERPELEMPKPAPVDLRKPKWRKEAVRLRWRSIEAKVAGRETARYYVVYRFTGDQPGSLDDPSNILAVTAIAPQITKWVEFYDERTEVGQTYTYVVTAVNRAHSESAQSNTRAILQKTTTRIRRAKATKVRKPRKKTQRVRRKDLRKSVNG